MNVIRDHVELCGRHCFRIAGVLSGASNFATGRFKGFVNFLVKQEEMAYVTCVSVHGDVHVSEGTRGSQKRAADASELELTVGCLRRVQGT